MDISNMQKCQEEYEKFLKESPLQSEIEKIARDIRERQDNAMAMEFTRVICNLLKENGVFIHRTEYRSMEDVSQNTMKERYGVIFDSVDFSEHDKKFTDEINRLKSELDRKETTIDQIDDILNELFDVTHDVLGKPDEFKKILKEKIEKYEKEIDELKIENAELHCEIQAMNVFHEGMPTEPIKVADMLISAERQYERNAIGKAFCGNEKGTYNLFDVSELRQIAEHLLVYCNANGEGEE